MVDSEKPLLLSYVNDAYEELSFARLAFAQTGGSLVAANVELRSPSFQSAAQIEPEIAMPSTASDARKLGTYDYYLADVEDSKYGRGHGWMYTRRLSTN